MKRTLFFLFLTTLLFCSFEVRAGIVPEDEWTDEAKLWLARSVIGEAGWRQFHEYSAIAYVYESRSKSSRKFDFIGMVKRYSAAVRKQGQERQPWLFEIGFDGKRPSSWPVDKQTRRGPLWEGLHQKAWLETLQWADEWQSGKHANPCPGANHFGGRVDEHRAHYARWTRVKCKKKTRNRFYTSLKKKKRLQPWRPGIKWS